MLINDIKNRDELCEVIVTELRECGVKYRREKRGKHNQEKNVKKKIFCTSLHLMDLTDVILLNGGIVQVPKFIADACQIILDNVGTEGLFRKAGSNMRQKEIRSSLEQGQSLRRDYHVIDVANVLKSFFRDLPEPILPPGNIQDSMLRSLLCKERKIEVLLMTCLLLPPLTLNTLGYFMQFLQTVSLHAKDNKMTVENLAIIFTPGIMPIVEIIGQRLNNHVKIVTMLIENAQTIGVLSENLMTKAQNKLGNIDVHMKATTATMQQIECDKKKKKRRSGSLTRMFNGFRKIVGAIGSSENLDVTPEAPHESNTTTPCLNKSAKKRKVTELQAFSSKKKKEVLSLQPDNGALMAVCTPLTTKDSKKTRLSIGGGKRSSKNTVITQNNATTKTGQMERRWSIVGAPWNRHKKCNETKIHKTSPEIEKPHLTPVASLPCLNSTSAEFKVVGFNRELFSACDDDETTPIEHSVEMLETPNSEDYDYVKISKSEYESIKERVSAIETRISQEFSNLITPTNNSQNVNSPEVDGPENVFDKYEKTLEDTEAMVESATTTNQLAKRLSRELKIRNSCENKAIRSPSARKIGAVRRKSRDSNSGNSRVSRHQSFNVENKNNTKRLSPRNFTGFAETALFYPKNSNVMAASSTLLRRGRPNTVQSGLRAISADKKINADGDNEFRNVEWKSADEYFKSDNMSTNNNSTITCARVASPFNKIPDTPKFISNLSVGELITPLLPPLLPPKKTPATFKTPSMHTQVLKNVLTPLLEQQTGRASIARIRCQNAGMVMAKAKLFDGMSTTTVTRSQDEPQRVIQCIPSKVHQPSPNSTPRRKILAKSPGRISRHRQRAKMMKSPMKSPHIMRAIKDEYLSQSLSSSASAANVNLKRISSPKIKKELLVNSPKLAIKTTPAKEFRPNTPMKIISGVNGRARNSPRLFAQTHQNKF